MRKSPDTKEQTLDQIIRDRQIDTEVKKGYLDLLVRIIVIVVAGYVLLTQVFFLKQAKGNDMFPAVKDGDLMIGYRLQREYAKNDVVVYNVAGREYVGRILGRATDVITLDDSGTLLVNGTAQSGEILYPTYAAEGIEYPFTVPDGCVFILGDYRTTAKDSRVFGAISLRDVEGKTITILRRRSL